MGSGSQEWGIAHVTHTMEPMNGERPGAVINIAHTLSNDEMELIEKCFSDLGFYNSGLGLYYSVQWNLQELIESIVQFAHGYLEEGRVDRPNMELVQLSFSRLTLNLLSMFKSFIDHGDAALTRRFGAEHDLLVEWKRQLSKQYDKSKGYRFFSNLRNYCQHVGMPPLHFSTTGTAESSGIQVQMYYLREELLSTYGKWSKHARIDLENGTDRLHLISYLQEWSICFHELSKWIMDVRREEALKGAQHFLEVRRRYGIAGHGQVAVMRVPIKDDSGAFDFSIRLIPEEAAQGVVDGHPRIPTDERDSQSNG